MNRINLHIDWPLVTRSIDHCEASLCSTDWSNYKLNSEFEFKQFQNLGKLSLYQKISKISTWNQSVHHMSNQPNVIKGKCYLALYGTIKQITR